MYTVTLIKWDKNTIRLTNVPAASVIGLTAWYLVQDRDMPIDAPNSRYKAEPLKAGSIRSILVEE